MNHFGLDSPVSMGIPFHYWKVPWYNFWYLILMNHFGLDSPVFIEIPFHYWKVPWNNFWYLILMKHFGLDSPVFMEIPLQRLEVEWCKIFLRTISLIILGWTALVLRDSTLCQDTMAEKIYQELEALWGKEDKVEMVREAFTKCRVCERWLYASKRSSIRSDTVQGCMNTSCYAHRPGKKSKGFMKAIYDSHMLEEHY